MWCKYHHLFPQSPFDEHLDCLPYFATKEQYSENTEYLMLECASCCLHEVIIPLAEIPQAGLLAPWLDLPWTGVFWLYNDEGASCPHIRAKAVLSLMPSVAVLDYNTVDGFSFLLTSWSSSLELRVFSFACF